MLGECLGVWVVGWLGGRVSSASPFFDCESEIFCIFGSGGHDDINQVDEKVRSKNVTL